MKTPISALLFTLYSCGSEGPVSVSAHKVQTPRLSGQTREELVLDCLTCLTACQAGRSPNRSKRTLGRALPLVGASRGPCWGRSLLTGSSLRIEEDTFANDTTFNPRLSFYNLWCSDVHVTRRQVREERLPRLNTWVEDHYLKSAADFFLKTPPLH